VRILVAGRFGKASGIDTYTRHLAQALQEHGHEVVTAYRTRASSQPGSAGEIVHIGAPNRPVRRLIGPLESIAAHRVLREVARSRECAVVHATYTEFVFAGPPPVVVTAWHPLSSWFGRSITAGRRSERFRSEALYAISDRRAYRRAAVVAISPAAQQDVRGRRQRAEWVPPFIPDRLVRPSNPERSRSCTFIARWLDAPRKGLDLAIAATSLLAAEMPGLRLQLVGGWREPAMAGRLPPHCVALGLRGPEEVSELLAASGCCLISSRWEEFGYSGLEALAAGTPLACTPLPGFEGLGSDGIVVAGRRDPAALAEAIRRALEIESFDFPVSCRSSVAIPRLEKLYFELAGDRS
jgi:glycosyltransferase involved in cell wall biosynthesis